MYGLTPRPVSHALGALAVLCSLVLLSPEAQAAIGVGAIDGIVSAFDNVRAFEGALMDHAKTLFWGLAVIEFTIVVGRQVIARADVTGILATVLFQVITIGFFYWLCIHGPDMTRAIINSFAQAASDASVSAGGSRTVSPGDIFKMGINLVKAVWDAMSLGSPVKSTLLAIAGLVVLWVFAKVAAMLLEVIVEGYVAASAATILLGFGGSSFTRNLAIAQFWFAVSVGMKRLVLQILVSLADAIMRGWAANVGKDPDWVEIAVIVGVPLVLMRLVETLPQRAQDLVTGAYSNMGVGLGDAPRQAMAAAAGAVVGTASGGAATLAAFRQASAQIAAREEGGSGGSISNNGGGRGALGSIARAAQVTGMAASNLGKAAASDIGQRMTGNYAAQHGHSGFRMADAMNARAGALRDATSNRNQGAMPAGSTRSAGNQVGPAPTAQP